MHCSFFLIQVEVKIGKSQDGMFDIDILDNLLIKDYGDLIHSIVTATYPDLHFKLLDSGYLSNRAILA